MPKTMTLSVEALDGSTRQVITDQRDSVAFERAERISVDVALAEMPTALFWCLAYYAEKRAGATTLTFKEWEAGTLRVDLEAVDGVDPTPTAAQPSSPSLSPSKPVSRSPRSRVGQVKSS